MKRMAPERAAEAGGRGATEESQYLRSGASAAPLTHILIPQSWRHMGAAEPYRVARTHVLQHDSVHLRVGGAPAFAEADVQGHSFVE